MAEKNLKDNIQKKIEIKTREPKKRDILPTSDATGINLHIPVREILDFPFLPESYEQENSDKLLPENDLASNSIIGYPKDENLDSQYIEIGYPSKEKLDSLISKNDIWISEEQEALDIKLSKDNFLDSQKTEKIGNWKKYEKREKEGCVSPHRRGFNQEIQTVLYRKGFGIFHTRQSLRGTNL